ncbi:MAG: hypothetical protein CRN43_19145 [Candidatus Nephrothrix sp. EaCA]|nr:MAG: hypothetical protein CRN43_19145 [Candidatus Nephrothrix sp. EaCA]
MAHKTFLSYTDADRQIIEPVALKLRGIFGKQVFYDSWSTRPGDGIINQINKGLEIPEFMFLFVSKESLAGVVASNMKWSDSLLLATKGKTKIIPVKVDDSEMPPVLRKVRCIDMHAIGTLTTTLQIANIIRSKSSFIPQQLNTSLLEEAKLSLERMQKFDVKTLPRVEELGKEMNFQSAVGTAERMVNLYKQLAIDLMDDLPQNVLQQLKDRADSDYSLFHEVLAFKVTQPDPQHERNNIIRKLESAHELTFSTLHPYVAYSLHRSADFQRLNTDARAMLQSISEQADEFTKKMNTHEGDAKRVLEEIRSSAGEKGVTHQADRFQKEATEHKAQAKRWLWGTIILAIILVAYVVLTLWLRKTPCLIPTTTYDAVQLSISKVLIFSVIAYMLFLSARNFLSHKHNAIVNRHRHNALVIHRVLIEAAGEQGNREAIMVQAMSYILAPQTTGYAGGAGNEGISLRSVAKLLSKSSGKGD